IFQLSGAIVESGDAILVKLVRGKDAFVHRELWPALARVVTDPSWRKPREAALSKGARALLTAAERASPLRLDEYAARTRTKATEERRELERSLLARADELHTERGAHTTVFETWETWVKREKLAGAVKKLSFEEALERIKSACGRVATAVD